MYVPTGSVKKATNTFVRTMYLMLRVRDIVETGIARKIRRIKDEFVGASTLRITRSSNNTRITVPRSVRNIRDRATWHILTGANLG